MSWVRVPLPCQVRCKLTQAQADTIEARLRAS